MNVAELIDKAKQATNSLGVVAEQLGKSQSRISEWKKGVGKPSATDIMLMAEMAGLPPLETLAEVESQLDADRASVWQRALSSLRTASVTGALALLVWTGLGMAPDHAQAAIAYPDSSLPSHGRGHWFDPSTAHQRIQGRSAGKSRVYAEMRKPFFLFHAPVLAASRDSSSPTCVSSVSAPSGWLCPTGIGQAP
ncbi:helix-turn-helix domain-containing protein [Burkholderia ambifaria]|uniref:HTH cro/C1-type domain-containing protein n=1 Tax=Burkholderia ambifaria MEX-5 TaxID=396597 RepID=B1T3R1_9BURK|nr:helix-turn-helix transcriptional regulator [Burkholderia ambifaria]EDT41776.1 hypothetical protein BamMEX5DRAFT_2427 [Burkholderia ambifaria MEX-5]